MLEDAAPMAAAEQLGQAVMEFDSSATVETVVELDEDGQVINASTSDDDIDEISVEIEALVEVEEVVDQEVATDVIDAVEEVTPESEDKSDEQK